MLLTCAQGCGITAAVLVATSFHPTARNHENTGPFITCNYVLMLVTSVTVSSLIVSRIWRAGQKDPLARALHMTVEAGLMYTVSVAILLGTYVGRNIAQVPIPHAVCLAVLMLRCAS